jgi:hypothetical protein
MKNLNKVNPFKSTVVKTDFGTLTTLVTEFGISTKESINFDGKTLLANYVYKKVDGTYNLVYTLIDNEGRDESFVEDDGVLPTLFLSPENEAYVSVVPYHPDKELEISIPIFNREKTDLPKGNRPFVGDFIGVSKQFSIFYNADIWTDTKPDKMLAIEFKNGVIKKKHNIKIPMPRDNKIFISEGEIHLLAREDKGWLHRQIDESGKTVRERLIKPNAKYFSQILNLSFENNSHILCSGKGKISIEIVSANGKCESKELADMKGSFYNMWIPEKIAENTYVTRFNGETGNGWFTIKDDQLLELFYSKGVKGFRNLLTDKVLQMDSDRLAISSLNKTADNAYAVVLFPYTDDDDNKELIILNRTIK